MEGTAERHNRQAIIDRPRTPVALRRVRLGGEPRAERSAGRPRAECSPNGDPPAMTLWGEER